MVHRASSGYNPITRLLDVAAFKGVISLSCAVNLAENGVVHKVPSARTETAIVVVSSRVLWTWVIHTVAADCLMLSLILEIALQGL